MMLTTEYHLFWRLKPHLAHPGRGCGWWSAGEGVGEVQGSVYCAGDGRRGQGGRPAGRRRRRRWTVGVLQTAAARPANPPDPRGPPIPITWFLGLTQKKPAFFANHDVSADRVQL